jgi:hypothetical protein
MRALAGQEGSGQFPIDGKNTFLGFAPIQRLGWAVIYARRVCELETAPSPYTSSSFI